jgi:YebC/PmpR family DNA-binding regulatory protein
MAGHSKFKNIQHRKGAQDKKRAKIFTKLVKEIITAVRLAGPDQNNNPRLRSAMLAARGSNLPKERIDRAISQGSGAGDVGNYVEIRYEGVIPGGIALIVEASTDNNNRTASHVRAAFTKFGGTLGQTGAVSFQFDQLGFIEYEDTKLDPDDLFEKAIEGGASDVASEEDDHIIYTAKEDFAKCLEYLTDKFGAPTESYIGWKAHNLIIIDDKAKAEKLLKLIDALEDSDDVDKVFVNYEFSSDIYNVLDK